MSDLAATIAATLALGIGFEADMGPQFQLCILHGFLAAANPRNASGYCGELLSARSK